MVDIADDKKPTKEENGTTPATPVDLDDKIISQVEYYFGDINLAKDKFLQEQTKLDDGWVTLETMLTFNRLANLTKDTQVIVEALAKSKSGLMEIHEDKTKIRRSPDLPVPENNENHREELGTRTVYCKGFPKDTPLDVLIEYFGQYDQVINVVKRNYHDKATDTWHFKGSVFVNFKTIEKAAEFLKLDTIKYKDEEITKMWMKDYTDMKRQERLEERAKRSNKKKASKEGEEEEEKEKPTPEGRGFNTGTVVQLTGIEEKDGVTIKWEMIKDAIQNLGIGVAYIDYSNGDETAWVRLEEKDAANELAKKVKEESGGQLEVGSNKLNFRVLDEKEEEAYFNKAKENIMLRKQRYSRKGGGKKGRGGKYKGSNRKRRGSPNPSAPANKVAR